MVSYHVRTLWLFPALQHSFVYSAVSHSDVHAAVIVLDACLPEWGWARGW